MDPQISPICNFLRTDRTLTIHDDDFLDDNELPPREAIDFLRARIATHDTRACTWINLEIWIGDGPSVSGLFRANEEGLFLKLWH